MHTKKLFIEQKLGWFRFIDICMFEMAKIFMGKLMELLAF